MAKYSPNPITDISQDWSRDPYNGLPFSGAAVQSFIKSNLGAIAKASYFDAQTMMLYYFASEGDKQVFIDNPARTDLVLFSTGITFSSDLFRIILTNNNGTTTLNVATNQTEVLLSIGFEVQTKSITDTVWSGTNSGVIATAYIDIGATGDYRALHEPIVYPAGETYTFDVRQYLAAGANRVRINFVDEDNDSITTSLTYTINMTEMFIEPLNNSWYLPIIEDGDVSNYKLGGYRIIGSLNKTLHMDIYSGDTKELSFAYSLGTASYDQVPFNYLKSMGLDLSDLSTGVYLVSAYLTSGSGESMLVSAPINYNIMYIASGEQASAKLVCINDVADKVYNYTTSRMFNYSIYNMGAMVGTPRVEVMQITGTTPTTIVDAELNDVSTSSLQSYEIDLEWLTEETLNLMVRATMYYGNRQTCDVSVDNSSTFPPTPGYDFYMNCGTRSNADSDYLKIVNAANKTKYTAQWSKMSWVDGVDGWIADDIARKCLYIRAGSKMALPYSQYHLLNSDGITLEFCYRVSNVSDYDEPIITIVDNVESPGFRGIKIKPTNITVHSSEDSTAASDIYRGTNLMDEEVVHFVLTIYPNFKGNQGKNLVTGYLNGCKNFQFEYGTGTAWNTEGSFVVGADKSDVSLYFVRKYNSVLSDANIQANYINSLKDISAREDMYNILASVMDANGTNISYESVKNSEKNFFVIEMLGGASVPSRANGWAKDDKGRCNLEMHYGKNPEWDWKLFGVEVGGQGTTSMNYYRWNLRWRIDKTNSDKKIPIAYLSSRSKRAGSYEYTWNDASNSKTVIFDGNGNHPAVKRLTAKINSASSMQSHKIGATWAYTELHDAIGLKNAAQNYADENNLPKPTVAVYQYPAYGFSKVGDSYSFIGMFTIGPDKGDKPTFGYDIGDVPSELITLEGTDHARKLVMFNHPWNSDVQYLASNEALNIVLGPNSYDTAWEVSNCHDLSTDKAADQATIQSILEAEFKPAYDLVFNNATLLVGIPLGEYGATAAATISAINANISSFISSLSPDNRTTMEFYHIWVEGDYNVYYYDLKENAYLPTGANLITDHGIPTGSTVSEENEWFKQKRRERFMASAENYWDIADSCYCYVFLMIYGSMDNFGKNSYPVKMGTFANGGRWGWRQDDLDSLGGIGNLGADTMPTWMEFQDSNNGAPYFGGSQSMFWNLIHECYMDDYVSTVTGTGADGIITTGKNVLQTMSSLASAGGGTLSGLMSYIKTRFWDKAQNYFPQSAYNADAAFKYETGWLDPTYSGVSLLQSLGNHYSAEYYWFYQRMIYMMSFFRVGAFGDYSDNSLGRINFRPYGWQDPTFTPSKPLYPAFAVGTTMQPTSRTWADNEHTFYGSFGNGETEVSIMASNMFTSFGDWKDLNLAPNYMQPVTIQAAKLQSFKIGDENAYTDEIITPAIYYTQEEINAAEEGDDAYGKTTEDIKVPAEYASNVTTNIPNLVFSGTKCLETIDARNASSLSGTIDISECSRLREAYLDGTSVTQIRFANGQPLEKINFPESVSIISMKNMRNLTTENMHLPNNLSGIELLQTENCSIDSIQILNEIYNTDNSNLRYISATVDDIRHIENEEFNTLRGLASDKDKDGNTVHYHGVTSSGAPAPTAKPSVDGTVMLDVPFYESVFEEIGLDPESAVPYGSQGLKIGLVSNLNALNLIFDPNDIYIPFVDNAVKTVCSNTWGDGYGLTYQGAAAVTSPSSVGAAFYGNTEIESFDEFRFFTGLPYLYGANPNQGGKGSFMGCSKLRSVILPEGMTAIGSGSNIVVFRGCKSLERIGIPSTMTTVNQYAFYNVGSPFPLSRIDFPSLNTILNINYSGTSWQSALWFYGSTADTRAFYVGGEPLTTVVIPNTRTSIRRGTFYKVNTLTSVTIPNSVDTIGAYAFYNCSGITSMTIPNTITTIGEYAFYGCSNMTGDIILPEVTDLSSSGNAFRGCSNITNVYIPNASVPQSVLRSCGNGTGTLIAGGYSRNTDNTIDWFFKNIVFLGNVSPDSSYGLRCQTYTEAIWIHGNANNSTVIFFTTNSSTRGKLKFFEFGGKTTTETAIFSAALPQQHCIIHLAYDTVTNSELPCAPGKVQASSSYIDTIYVGIGDADTDAEILQMYLADESWAALSSKLAKWSDYDGEYKTPPTIPGVDNE